MYPADGRKLPDCWTHPPQLRNSLQGNLGQFPLFKFWGPMTSIDSTQWIADAAMEVEAQFSPTLSLIYLPHLDYGFQRHGPNSPLVTQDIRDLDKQCGILIDYFTERGAKIVILSEYGITPVSRPVHLNRALREHGLIAIREEVGLELLDAGESAAFAMADHQIAHVYVNDPTKIDQVRKVVEAVAGVARVYAGSERDAIGLNHARSGELIALAEPDAWFTYYYWMDDSRAPDFARTVDIHRKPGYDPVELFLDPQLPAAKLQIAWKLLRRKMGMRGLLDVIGLDALIVKGSHGLPPRDAGAGPCVIADEDVVSGQAVEATAVRDLILRVLQTKAAANSSV
jgi:predicted AlkP superfamily pyrophosphatase or phosphodiesterase